MGSYPKILEQLIESLGQLPGIGRRSAERIALYLLEAPQEKVKTLSGLMSDIKDKIKPCKICNNFSTEEVCSICNNSKRDKSIVCVVEYPKDVMALEKTSAFNGIYYVLLGSVSPLEGRGPETIDLGKLIKRISENKVSEVVIATDSDSEGQATAIFLKQSLHKFKVKVSRLSIGLPIGSQIEYTDAATLGKSIQERRIFE